MNTLEPVLHAAQVVGAGLIAGSLLIVTAAVVPSMRGMTLESYVGLHQVMERRVDRYLPWIGKGTVALSLAAVVFSSRGWVWALAIAGLAMLATVIVTSELRMAACNKAIATWQPATLPAEAGDVVARWSRLNAIRTIFAVAAFITFVVAAAIAG